MVSCGGNEGGSWSGGTIQSPDYPLNYPNNADCVWVISVAKQNHIHLEMITFDLYDDHGNCSDYVEIRSSHFDLQIVQGTDIPVKELRHVYAHH